jgi:hypothetical protein
MKKFSSRLLAAGLLAAAFVPGAHAAITAAFDFDSVATGSAAGMFDTANFSFHNAVFAPLQDADGLDIPGSERWTVDLATDAYAPITVDNPADFGFGAAPSGSNALNAYFGPVFIKFDQAYNLGSFTATLDNSALGDLGSSHIWFVSPTAVVDSLAFDATVPGATLSKTDVAGVTGIVMQGGSFYDNVSLNVTAIPEPSTYGILAGAAGLGLALFRRFRRRN